MRTRLMPVLAGLAAAPAVGGQAVMEGVMMRAGASYAVAVRRPDGEITVAVRPWFSLVRSAWLKKPFVRGFPVLMETMVNGISALNHSAQEATKGLPESEGGDGQGMSSWALALTMVLAVAMALGLFVVLPHALSVGLNYLGLSGGLDSLSFHAWDGAIKLAVFVGYIWSISLLPDIRRVFQYHGAEHKSIWAFESGAELTPASARLHSRLHPRCGTTFLLFVLALSIALFAVLVPLLLSVWAPQGAVLKQAYAVLVKFVLMIPVSCLAYELIKLAGRYDANPLMHLVSLPGMAMQRLTTYEPDESQIEVALAALRSALAVK